MMPVVGAALQSKALILKFKEVRLLLTRRITPSLRSNDAKLWMLLIHSLIWNSNGSVSF